MEIKNLIIRGLDKLYSPPREELINIVCFTLGVGVGAAAGVVFMIKNFMGQR